MNTNTKIAILLFKIGFKYKVSKSITDDYTYGYGKLNEVGHWQYELPYKYVFKR